MNSIDKVNNLILELFKDKQTIFVSGDIGVSELQRDLRNFKMQLFLKGSLKQDKYENSNGIFIRFSIGNAIYSGIIQTENTQETRTLLLTLPHSVFKEGFETLSILKLPLIKIPLFPMFTIIDGSEIKEFKEKLTKQYWLQYSDDLSSLRGWYLDFMSYKRQLLLTEAPLLEPDVPTWLEPMSVFALYNHLTKTIAVRYYRNKELTDQVYIKETTDQIGIKAMDVFEKLFNLPSSENLLSETVHWVGEGKRVYEDWEHPLFAAVNELKEQIKKFNAEQKEALIHDWINDAFKLSHALIYYWTYKDIEKRRDIVRRFPFLEICFNNWLGPVKVNVRYFVEKPVEGKITDGLISATYVKSNKDEIIIERVPDREAVRKYLNEDCSSNTIYAFSTYIRYFIADKLGDEH